MQHSATALGTTLTPDDVAIRRAGDSMKRLDAMVETMRRDGTLRVFNARYQAGRAAAAAEGKGFMSFGVAMARFKKALIPMLQSGKPISGVFEDVLGEKGSDPSFVLTAGSMAATIRFQLHSKDQFLSGRKKSGTSSGSSLS